MKKIKIKVYVVSLLDQKDRREYISSQLNDLGVDYTFFNAINVSANPDYLKYVDLNKMDEINGRNLSNGEIGCSLSHYFIYKEIVDKKVDYALVLEDDAIINPNITEFIENFVVSYEDWDVVLLGYSKVSEKDYSKINKFNPIGKPVYSKETKVGRVLKNTTCGTVGYLISFEGANKFLKTNFAGNTIADNWPYFEKKANLKIFHCRPFLIFEDFLNLKSSIENERFFENKVKSGSNFLYDFLKYVRGFFRSFLLLLK